MRDETLVEQVERLERIVSRLEKIVNGDQELGVIGLMAELRDIKVNAQSFVTLNRWRIGFAVQTIGIMLAATYEHVSPIWLLIWFASTIALLLSLGWR
jgi:hypothetical protein